MEAYAMDYWTENTLERSRTSRSGDHHPTSDIDFASLELMDALDLAVLIEQEAVERYEEFSRMVGNASNRNASDLFRAMAAGERIHGDQLITRRWRLYQDTPTRVHREMVFDVEAPGYRRIHTELTPRQAMQIALEAEQKAYEFYTEALPFVDDPDVRELFRQLQTEEKEHRELLAWRIRDLPIEGETEETHRSDPVSRFDSTR